MKTLHIANLNNWHSNDYFQLGTELLLINTGLSFPSKSIPFEVLFQENEIQFQESEIQFPENEIEFQENELQENGIEFQVIKLNFRMMNLNEAIISSDDTSFRQ